MTTRAILILLGLSLVNAGADPGTYLRGQNFAVFPDTWRQAKPSQFYGYEATDMTGGKAAAGGLFMPGTLFNYYADVFLGGGMRSSQTITAHGRVAIHQVTIQPPFETSAYIAHFGRPVGPYIDMVGFALTGSGYNYVTATPVVQFSNGSAYAGKAVPLAVGGDFFDWIYTWDPVGGKNGAGSLVLQFGDLVTQVELPKAAGGYDFSVNSFGWFQPPFPSARSDSYMWAYIGNVVYTAGLGQPPKLKVNRPPRFSVTATDVSFHGTASLNVPAYRLKSLTYRTIHEGKTSARYPVRGLKKWNCRIRVKHGFTRIQFLATSDSGATTLIERRVSNRLVVR